MRINNSWTNGWTWLEYLTNVEEVEKQLKQVQEHIPKGPEAQMQKTFRILYLNSWAKSLKNIKTAMLN